MAGSRMLTAEVFAFTTSVEMQVAASTPPVRVLACTTSLIRPPSRNRPGPGRHPITVGRSHPAAFTLGGRGPAAVVAVARVGACDVVRRRMGDVHTMLAEALFTPVG